MSLCKTVGGRHSCESSAFSVKLLTGTCYFRTAITVDFFKWSAVCIKQNSECGWPNASDPLTTIMGVITDWW